MPEISILVPVYKVENSLAKCIESVLKQDFQDWEMILVDDGSPDNSGIICDEYATKDCRIKVVHKENGGLISARREGFINSSGTYLVFLDSDDTLAEMALSTLYNNIVKGYDIIKAGVVKTDKEDVVISYENFPFLDGEIVEREYFIKKTFIGDIAPYLCGSIYKRELFTEDIFSKSIEAKISFGEDWVTNLLISKNVQKVLCIKDVVYNYFINNESITNSQVVSVEYIDRVQEVLKKEGILDLSFLSDYIKIWYALNRINRFFIPELGFRYDDYKHVKEIINRGNFKLRIRERTNKRFLYFINYMPLYYIYTKFYGFIFCIFKLNGRRRKVLK